MSTQCDSSIDIGKSIPPVETNLTQMQSSASASNFKMGSQLIESANPVVHLMHRQIGNNILHFRQNLFRERLASARNLYCRNLVSHYGCVNAIEFSSDGDLLISGKLHLKGFQH